MRWCAQIHGVHQKHGAHRRNRVWGRPPIARDNIINFRPVNHSPLTPVEAALIHLSNAVPAFGVVIDTKARFGVVYDGREAATFIDLDDGEMSFGILVPDAVELKLRTSDASAYGLVDAARDTLAFVLAVRRRHAARFNGEPERRA